MVHGKTPNCGRWDFFRHFRHVCLFFELRRRSYAANHPLSKAAQWLWIRLPRSRTRSSPLNPKSKRMTTRIGWSFFLVRQMGLFPAFQTRLLVLRTAQTVLCRKPPAIQSRTVALDTASEKPHAVKSPQSKIKKNDHPYWVVILFGAADGTSLRRWISASSACAPRYVYAPAAKPLHCKTPHCGILRAFSQVPT